MSNESDKQPPLALADPAAFRGADGGIGDGGTVVIGPGGDGLLRIDCKLKASEERRMNETAPHEKNKLCIRTLVANELQIKMQLGSWWSKNRLPWIEHLNFIRRFLITPSRWSFLTLHSQNPKLAFD